MTISFTGVRVGVVSVVVMAAVVTACFPRPEHRLNVNKDDKVRKFPCPNDEDIFPCTCTYTTTIDFTCSNLTSVEELTDVFQASFPINKLNSFVLQYSNVSLLPNGVFGNIAFGSVTLEGNNLVTVEEEVFKNSFDFMEEFYLYEKVSDVTYDWPLANIAQFTKLTTIHVSGPYADVSDLESATLTSATLSLYQLASLQDNMFSGAPNLVNITLTNTPLESIAGNTFQALKHLENLEISDANIHSLDSHSFAFEAENLTYVRLSWNSIETISEGAFSGIAGEVVVDLSNNLLTELHRDVYYSTIEQLTTGLFLLDNNPLQCGCDLVWIATLTEDERSRLSGVVSSCNMGTIDDLDTLIDFLMYQCST